MFNKNNINSAKGRLLEETIYEQVAEEIQGGNKRMGLWAKSLSTADGNEELAKAKYIELRVQSIKDEFMVAQEAERAERAERARNDNTWNVVIDSNDEVTRKLITRARNKKANFEDLTRLCLKMGISPKGRKGLFKDSWVINDQNGNELRFNDSDDLEIFLVKQYVANI